MENKLRIPVIILLIFNGVSASFGGFGLFVAPDGSLLHYELEWLQYSPFNDYLIPGILLFTFIGLFSLGVSVLTILNHRTFPFFVTLEACILLIWLILEIIMIRSFHWIFIVYGIISIILIVMAMILRRQKAQIASG